MKKLISLLLSINFLTINTIQIANCSIEHKHNAKTLKKHPKKDVKKNTKHEKKHTNHENEDTNEDTKKSWNNWFYCWSKF